MASANFNVLSIFNSNESGISQAYMVRGLAWYSYFGDTGFKLVSELLLHDEELIEVDESREANYAHITNPDGTTIRRWINPPREFDHRAYPSPYRRKGIFMPMAPGFDDAATLQPVTLAKGRFTTLFLTAHITTNDAPGLYHGAISLQQGGTKLGEIPVILRVLPFALPAHVPISCVAVCRSRPPADRWRWHTMPGALGSGSTARWDTATSISAMAMSRVPPGW